jgi:hypothetical protein
MPTKRAAPKKAPAHKKPTLPKQSHEKPVVVDTHQHAAAAVRSGAAHVLVHKSLLSHYANILKEHKKLGAKIPQTMIDNLHKYANGKDTHALIGGNWFTSAFRHVGHAISTAAKWTGNAVLNTGKFIGNAAGKVADVVGSVASKATDVANKVAPLVQAVAPIIKAVAA